MRSRIQQGYQGQSSTNLVALGKSTVLKGLFERSQKQRAQKFDQFAEVRRQFNATFIHSHSPTSRHLDTFLANLQGAHKEAFKTCFWGPKGFRPHTINTEYRRNALKVGSLNPGTDITSALWYTPGLRYVSLAQITRVTRGELLQTKFFDEQLIRRLENFLLRFGLYLGMTTKHWQEAFG